MHVDHEAAGEYNNNLYASTYLTIDIDEFFRKSDSTKRVKLYFAMYKHKTRRQLILPNFIRQDLTIY